MPHGENLVLVLRDGVPVRVLMKDIGEEVAVMGDQPLPPDVERIRVEVGDDVKALALHTDVFDGFLRYLAAILDTDGVLPADDVLGRGGAMPAASTPRSTRSSPTRSRRTTSSARSSTTAASTGSSCATPWRWSTSPTRPSR